MMKLRFFFLPWLFSSVILGLLLYYTDEYTYNILALKFDIIVLLFLSIVLGVYYFIFLFIMPHKKKLIPKKEEISYVSKTELFIALFAVSTSVPLLLFLYEIDYIGFDSIEDKILIFESMLVMLSSMPFSFFYFFSLFHKD